MATMIDSPLFGDLFSTEEMRKIFSDETTIQKVAGRRSRPRPGRSEAGNHSPEVCRGDYPEGQGGI